VLREFSIAAVLASCLASADCIPFTDAPRQIGASKRVTGKVLKVTRLSSGATFLNFCYDYRTCPFQVVVFRGDLRHVGDVRQLEGRVIEIRGDIKEYDGRPEIILRDARQLRGEAGKIPPLPKDYDVEKNGRFSVGRMKYPKSAHKGKRRGQQPPPIQTEEPEPE
jgi:DNA/RNA endonuclease YhcR with UshA esterase domain